MKVDGRLGGHGWGIADVTATAAGSEKSGYGGMRSSESRHDPFLPPDFAAEHTGRIDSAPRSGWLSPARPSGSRTPRTIFGGDWSTTRYRTRLRWPPNQARSPRKSRAASWSIDSPADTRACHSINER